MPNDVTPIIGFYRSLIGFRVVYGAASFGLSPSDTFRIVLRPRPRMYLTWDFGYFG